MSPFMKALKLFWAVCPAGDETERNDCLSSQRTEKVSKCKKSVFTYVVLTWAMLVDEAILVKTTISLLLINEALEGARATARRVGHDDDYLF